MVILNEEEINLIRMFIEDAKNIPFVDGIFIDAYGIEGEEPHIYVNALVNNSLSYKEQLFVSGYVIDKKQIDEDLSVLRAVYPVEGRLSFQIGDFDDYSLSLMTNREISAEMSLISGTILFDRFKNLRDNKEEASKLIGPFKTALQIQNVNELQKNGKRKNKSIF